MLCTHTHTTHSKYRLIYFSANSYVNFSLTKRGGVNKTIQKKICKLMLPNNRGTRIKCVAVSNVICWEVLHKTPQTQLASYLQLELKQCCPVSNASLVQQQS